MPQLPFKTAPVRHSRTIGNPSTGEVEFPVYGSLLWEEREAVREHDSNADPFRAIGSLANEIAEAEGIEPADAFGLVAKILRGGQALDPEEVKIRVRHLVRIQSFTVQALTRSASRRVALVTAGIRARLEGCEAWTLEDTRQLPEALIEAIGMFLDEEEARMTQPNEAPPEQARAELTEALGKSPTEPMSDPPNPTGQPSSGASSTHSPETHDSAPTTSPGSQSPSSVARSRQRRSRSASEPTSRNDLLLP